MSHSQARADDDRGSAADRTPEGAGSPKRQPVTVEQGRPGPEELLALYRAVGWTAYTDEPETLLAAVDGSWRVWCARDDDGALVGLARVVSDGHTIAYLQDILVHPDHHRRGVGGALLDAVIAHTTGLRQLVLTTDTEPGQRAFYESRGLVEAHDHRPGLRSFVLFR